jgi:hypothetical protein
MTFWRNILLPPSGSLYNTEDGNTSANIYQSAESHPTKLSSLFIFCVYNGQQIFWYNFICPRSFPRGPVDYTHEQSPVLITFGLKIEASCTFETWATLPTSIWYEDIDMRNLVASKRGKTKFCCGTTRQLGFPSVQTATRWVSHPSITGTDYYADVLNVVYRIIHINF